MSYLFNMYGKQSFDFIKGFLAAMDTYAVWKDGKQYIGSPKKELKREMEKAVNELAENPAMFIPIID